MTSGLTIGQILSFDARALHTAATAFDELAKAVDDRHDELVPLYRGVEEAWDAGEAQAAAVGHCKGLRQELERAYPPLVGVGQILLDHAVSADRIKIHLAEAVDTARRFGPAAFRRWATGDP